MSSWVVTTSLRKRFSYFAVFCNGFSALCNTSFLFFALPFSCSSLLVRMLIPIGAHVHPNGCACSSQLVRTCKMTCFLWKATLFSIAITIVFTKKLNCILFLQSVIQQNKSVCISGICQYATRFCFLSQTDIIRACYSDRQSAPPIDEQRVGDSQDAPQ